MLKTIQPRLYQEAIFSTTTTKNTLVVLPTGLGKTALAMMLAQHRLQMHQNSKILMVAPTKPLVEQHCERFKQNLDYDDKEFVIFTGTTSPQKRAELWKTAKFIFSTPQGLENDIISDRIDLKEVSLLVFDEAHRAVGDYAYVFVAKQYEKKATYPRILALTASPGSDVEKIEEVCTNLHIENVEVRTEDDADVKDYVQPVTIDWISVELPPAFSFIRKTIEECYNSKLRQVKQLGYLNSIFIRKIELLKLQAKLHAMLSREKSMEIMKSISLIAEATKIQHALELLETQGINILYLYFEKLIDESTKTKVKAVKNLVADENFNLAYQMTKKLYENNIDHPKLKELKKIILKNKDKKIIVFSHFRDTATKIKSELDELPGIESKVFVGQAKRREPGLNQKQQKQMLDEFRNNEFNVLIATSVAEEGLDVPSVDMVVFYEPIPSAIRTIQRRGRTGRNEAGGVIILMAKNTRDEGYRWSTHHKEKRMHRILKDLKNKITLKSNTASLEKFIPQEEIKVICDDREKGNGIIKELIDLGAKVELKRLDVGDYVVSDRCIIELKTVPDFVDSIIDGRLLEQLRYLSKVEKPILIIEGDDDIYSQRKIHPNAIRGMLSTIAVSYGIPILQTKNFRETAAFLKIIAKREQDPEKSKFSAHGSKKPLNMKELQEYIVSSLPNIGPSTAKELLHNFRSVRKIMNASEDELKKVPGVGDKLAQEIQKTLDRDYYI